jgi:hypothetical protein
MNFVKLLDKLAAANKSPRIGINLELSQSNGNGIDLLTERIRKKLQFHISEC